MAKREVKNIDGFEKELLSETERVELFISKYWVKVAIAAVIVVLAGVGIYAAVKSSNDKKFAIQQKFVSAEADELADLISANASVAGVDLARFRLAGMLVEKKDLAGAAAQLKAVYDNPEADVILRQCAAFEMAGILEQSGKAADAAKVMAAVADDTAFSAGVKLHAGCQAARMMLSNKDVKGANEMLKRMVARKGLVTDDYTFPAWMSQCEQMLAAIENGDFTVKAVEKKADAKK